VTSDRLTLGFDTSAAHCAAALVSGGRVLARADEETGRGQAERLVPLLEAVLRAGGVGWGDLGAVGVGTGPGNFTGLRVAVACARGLAMGLGVPAEGVPAADALAWAPGGPRAALVCLPAPRGRAMLGPPGATPILADPEDPAFARELPAAWRLPCLGPEAERIAGALGLPLLPAADIATGIAQLAAIRAAPGRPRPAPVYLRPADAAPPADPPPVVLTGAAT
jgi:tRNA threonylcarbamoyl adenosine modification protein YeaZ